MKEAPCTRCCVQCREGDVGLPGGKCKLEVHWELQTQLHKLTCIISIIPPLSSFFTFVRSSLCYSCLQYIQGRQFVRHSVVPAPVSRHSGSLLQYQCNSRLCNIIHCMIVWHTMPKIKQFDEAYCRSMDAIFTITCPQFSDFDHKSEDDCDPNRSYLHKWKLFHNCYSVLSVDIFPFSNIEQEKSPCAPQNRGETPIFKAKSEVN